MVETYIPASLSDRVRFSFVHVVPFVVQLGYREAGSVCPVPLDHSYSNAVLMSAFADIICSVLKVTVDVVDVVGLLTFLYFTLL